MLLFLFHTGLFYAADTLKPVVRIYQYDIMQEIAEPVWRITKESFKEAENYNADYILIHMNTYGGLVTSADSIRTKILNSRIPVMVFIDNNAASAGALIAISCDSIYMRPGGNIGAATVVNQSGQPVPDKFQSFMRSTMRATAEAHGKDTTIVNGDTVIAWRRDPHIAEAMVDPSIYVKNISDTGKVLTFTANEAVEAGYCEGLAENIPEVLKKSGIEHYEIKKYEPTTIDAIIHFLVKPAISGLLIMIIIGGIYFELQSPGIGFPLAAAVTAAVIYFMPLYIEGLAQNWELLLFIVGLILIAVEIFAIPGFGFAGISGLVLMVTGLTLSMVDNVQFHLNPDLAIAALIKALSVVLLSVFLAFALSLILTKKLFSSRKLKFALHTVQQKESGFVGVDAAGQKENIGKKGIAVTVLRPAGKVEVDGEVYDAMSEVGYIDRNEPVKVVRDEAGQLFVIKDSEEV